MLQVISTPCDHHLAHGGDSQWDKITFTHSLILLGNQLDSEKPLFAAGQRMTCADIRSSLLVISCTIGDALLIKGRGVHVIRWDPDRSEKLSSTPNCVPEFQID